MFVLGEMAKLQWQAPLPNLPGVDPEDWVFDFAAQAERAKLAALSELLGA
jgi:hypothetical protein